VAVDKTIPSWPLIVVLIILQFVVGCCLYPKSHVPVATIRTSTTSVTIVAYGDTRTGLWGLGDNPKQAIHGSVVDDIFEHDQPVDAVIFTGDAVMSNFFLWKKAYWRCFLCQTDRFRAVGIPFYPSLGNHEVLSPLIPAIRMSAQSSANAQQKRNASKATEHEISEAYDRGEEPTRSPEPMEEATSTLVDPYSKKGQAILKQWEKGINKGDVDSANNFGQFERQVQMNFYQQLEKDDRCDADSKTFESDYLTGDKYEYLRTLLQGRSYYSTVIDKQNVRVKLIALDTNCLDSEKQRSFFATEVDKPFDGPIIVFGHHPPVDYESPDGWPWDKVKGWDDLMKSYFTDDKGKRIVLWIFGHVHDYQRRSPNLNGGSPVLLIAGGGGASLDPNAASFQWQPTSWPQPFQQSAYSQVRILITDGRIQVDTRGASTRTDPFTLIETFSIPWPPQKRN
jgi:hypothetical protein